MLRAADRFIMLQGIDCGADVIDDLVDFYVVGEDGHDYVMNA